MDEDRRNSDYRDLRDEVVKGGVRMDHLEKTVSDNNEQNGRRFSEVNIKIETNAKEARNDLHSATSSLTHDIRDVGHQISQVATTQTDMKVEHASSQKKMAGILVILIPLLSAVVIALVQHYLGT